jgi:glycosyltransferase involved in cell wall biosynthesis
MNLLPSPSDLEPCFRTKSPKIMAKQIKVSVVVPSYNRAYIIRDALESVLAQTYGDFEIIVVDDGSSDNTREIVEEMKSEKIRYIRHERNRGYSAANNTGIAAAGGEFVAFLDSDDLWKANYLGILVSFLEAHVEADVVFCDTEVRSDSENVPSLVALMKSFSQLLQADTGKSEHVFTARQMYVCLLEEVPIKPSAVVVRREMFEKAGTFDEAWPSGTDWDLFLRFSHSAGFGYIDLPLVVQRRTGDATHQKFRVQDKLFLLGQFLKEKEKLRNDHEALIAVNRGISGHCSNLGWDYLHSGQRKKSMAVYLRGFRETREPAMLIRAASALLPLGVRAFLKGDAKQS